jgi:DNA polymerase-1
VKTDCALLHAPTDLALQVADAERLKTLYERFEFKQWLRDGTGRDSRAGATRAAVDRHPMQATMQIPSTPRCHADRAGARSRGPSTTPGRARHPPRPMRLLPCRDTTRRCWTKPRPGAMAGEIERAELVCFDTETTSLDPMQAKIVGLSFAIEPGVACYIPLAHRYPALPTSCRSSHARAPSRRGLRTRRAGSSARTSSTTSTCSPTTVSCFAASRTTRCFNPTCSRRTVPTTWTTSRGAT